MSETAHNHSATTPDGDPLATEANDQLADYGISTVQVTAYEWGGYRYTNAKDALAAAKRGNGNTPA